MAPSRNFRTTYYKTLGVPVVQHVVDVEASYHALFEESVVNTAQLMKLALEVGIAPSFRPLAWKVLCGVLPAYKCLWEMAERERQQMYDDLVDAAVVLELPCQDECRPAVTVEEETSAPDTHSKSDSVQKLIRLYRIYRKDVLRAKPLSIVDTSDCILSTNRLEGIVRALETVLTDSVADQFWCLTRIVDTLDDAHRLLEPTLWSEMLDEVTAQSLETLFIRSLDCIKTTGRA
jgi:hypothetical protein